MPFNIRRCVQLGFLLLVILIGIKFYFFVSQIETGILPNFERPPGVEAFLPIGALVSLKHLFFTGTINSIHPSGLVIFLIICLTALIIKKGFCSWICPFGLLTEFFNKLHLLFFNNSFFIPQWIDISLRTIKYIIVGFFIYTIFFKMPINSIEQFIQSPYNRFSDIKMLHFFTNISKTTLIVLLVLSILSILIRNMWCRYLCPYGALLGLISFMSIGMIKRDSSHCTGCGKCEKKCSGLIKIRQKKLIHSSECTACLECTKICPEKKAIGFSMFSGKIAIGPTVFAMIFIMLFTIGISIAKVSGNWQNEISKKEYLYYFMQYNMPWSGEKQINQKKMMELIQLMEAQKAQLQATKEKKLKNIE